MRWVVWVLAVASRSETLVVLASWLHILDAEGTLRSENLVPLVLEHGQAEARAGASFMRSSSSLLSCDISRRLMRYFMVVNALSVLRLTSLEAPLNSLASVTAVSLGGDMSNCTKASGIVCAPSARVYTTGVFDLKPINFPCLYVLVQKCESCLNCCHMNSAMYSIRLRTTTSCTISNHTVLK